MYFIMFIVLARTDNMRDRHQNDTRVDTVTDTYSTTAVTMVTSPKCTIRAKWLPLTVVKIF